MTLILHQSDWHDLHAQAPAICPQNLVLDDFEDLTGVV